MDCSNKFDDGIAINDQEQSQKNGASSNIRTYIKTVLSELRDNLAKRLNLVICRSPSVEAEPLPLPIAAGIICALQMNQWFFASTQFHLHISQRVYLPLNVLRNLLYRVLQTQESGELIETKAILNTHIFLHPPRYTQVSIRKLYNQLLIEQCAEMLNGGPKTDGFIIQILGQLRQMCGSDSERPDSDEDHEEMDAEEQENQNQEELNSAELPLQELFQHVESLQLNQPLSAEEKLIRLNHLLDFAITVLEQDFLAWYGTSQRFTRLLRSLNHEDERPLIVALAWPRALHWRIGTCNSFCRVVTQMLWNDQLKDPLLRLLALLAELMCITECKGQFPSLGNKCCALAREVSIGMSQSPESFVHQVVELKPDWLALLVMHQAITKILQPGNVGMPSLDLVEACMILLDQGPDNTPKTKLYGEIDPELVERPNKLNKRSPLGETRIHIACRKNNVKELEKLLQQPHINVNLADNAGWTPLHEAVVGGVECVQMLLEYRSQAGVTVDSRAKNGDGVTPIMDAAIRGRADICKVLLENSGWCLLEDKQKDGLQAGDFAKSAEVKAVLDASRLGKRTIMFNNLTCVNLPALATYLPVYYKLYLATYQTHLVAEKLIRRETPSSSEIMLDSSGFDTVAMFQSLKVFKNICKIAIKGSEIDQISRGLLNS